VGLVQVQHDRLFQNCMKVGWFFSFFCTAKSVDSYGARPRVHSITVG